MSEIGFKITLDLGKQVVNFLDVTLNLSDQGGQRFFGNFLQVF